MAIVGGTGAGKSTLLSLVPRFYDPTAGAVMLGGRDLRSITKRSLRAQIGIVLQDTLLFSSTVRENIAYGRPDAADEEIIEAARRAQAHEFIRQLPNGYASQVGERGAHLSVGQRQRIGIARAFLKDAPVLLLDEPTSALDPATEAAIMETISELMRGRTTLIAPATSLYVQVPARFAAPSIGFAGGKLGQPATSAVRTTVVQVERITRTA